jgi:hypothetical protein
MTKFIQLIPPFPHFTAPLILDGKKQRYATEKSEMINRLQDSRREDEHEGKWLTSRASPAAL